MCKLKLEDTTHYLVHVTPGHRGPVLWCLFHCGRLPTQKKVRRNGLLWGEGEGEVLRLSSSSITGYIYRYIYMYRDSRYLYFHLCTQYETALDSRNSM